MKTDPGGSRWGIEYAHAAVHQDIICRATEYVDSLNGDRFYLIKAPADKEVHLQWALTSSGSLVMEMYENPTVSDNGTQITASRLNRGSNKSDPDYVFHTPTVSDNGKLLSTEYNGGTPSQKGSDAHEGSEWLIPAGESILIKCTTSSNENVHVVFEWYEIG